MLRNNNSRTEPSPSANRAFALDELPPPPPDRQGWPWTEAVQVSQSFLGRRSVLPTVSVVTPSFNQGAFIERTLRSVLLQGYPAVELIVIDGGSTDHTRVVLEKYRPFLTHCISEPDRGQAHAINKGFALATGDILCWINSDDYYLPGAFFHAARYFSDPTIAVTCGNVLQHHDGIERHSDYVRSKFRSRRRFLQFWRGYTLNQASMFWRREVSEAIGPLREDLHYILDFDYFARVAERFPITVRDDLIAAITYHPDAKTGDGYRKHRRELRRHAKSYWGSPRELGYWTLWLSMHAAPVTQRVARLRKLVKRR